MRSTGDLAGLSLFFTPLFATLGAASILNPLMKSCCTDNCCGTDRFFSRLSVFFDRQYKKHGLEKLQRLLVDAVRKEAPLNASVLDIGCGVGALHLALLSEGAERAVAVEISEGMLERARRNAVERGLDAKTEYLQGDFVERQNDVGVCDVTLLDKVVCCYADERTLLGGAMRKTAELLAITHPRNNLLAALLFKSHIAVARLFRFSFHPFWHDWELMHQEILSGGFVLLSSNHTPVWQARLYRRMGSGHPAVKRDDPR